MGKKVGRKPHGIKVRGVHVQVPEELYLRVGKRRRLLGITLRAATEQGLELFLRRSVRAKEKTAS